MKKINLGLAVISLLVCSCSKDNTEQPSSKKNELGAAGMIQMESSSRLVPIYFTYGRTDTNYLGQIKHDVFFTTGYIRKDDIYLEQTDTDGKHSKLPKNWAVTWWGYQSKYSKTQY